MNSWVKVASGARLVASAVAQQTAKETSVAVQKLSHHGADWSSTARQVARAAHEAFTAADGWESFEAPLRSSAQPGSTSTANQYNPYESQLHRPQTPSHPTEDTSIASETPPETGDLHQEGELLQYEAKMVKPSTPPIPNPYLLHAEPPPSITSPRPSNPSGPIQPQAPTTTTANLEGSSASPLIRPNDHRRSIESIDAVPERLQEGRPVPATRVERAFGFASLGAGLALGTASELASRILSGGGSQNGGSSSSVVASNANADRLAATLCRMRGAALKMGQMLSIQDESLLPPALTRALNQVRQGADAMPHFQFVQQMESQLGKDWRKHFETFEDLPFAAASIGQVHRATIRDPENGSLRPVVVKVQYPGVANSIESDLRNLTMLVTMTGLAPKGLFIENVIRVGRDELKVECKYLNEMANQRAFQKLVSEDPFLQEHRFVVPDVIEDLTTEQVIVSEYVPGGTIDKVKFLDQEERNRIGRAIMYLTMRELFVWRFMQTDPNWGNFLYDLGSGQTALIDFGAAREYPKDFVDGYLRIVWANANQDEQTLMEQSRKLGFLTGEENDTMLEAHKLSGFTLGEPFASNEPFDFQGSRISTRMSEHTSVFLKHRLTPPPEEVYTLHRKLAGAYMLCIKLGAFVQCRDMLEDVIREHDFQDGLPHPIQSSPSAESAPAQ